MPSATVMTINERRKYLTIMRLHYLRAGRQGKGALLTEMEEVTLLDRKTLIRSLHGDLSRHPRQTQRQATYGPEVDDAIRVIADSYDHLCAERLTPNLVQMASQLARHDELVVTPTLLAQLGDISVSTVRRILQRTSQGVPMLPRPQPSVVNAARRDIPMSRIPWDTTEPGHFETDLVHHCGESTSGQYMHTLQLIDVATGWSERVALLGRRYARMQDAFGRILRRLPFAIKELHPDNGSEFFNAYLLEYWAKEVAHAYLSRSRPFRKNDNRFVEQKNSSLVRAFFGSYRLDTITQTVAANRLYDLMWVYYNLFQPVLHLIGKAVVTTKTGATCVRRTYDTARTPFDRLCATGVLDPARQEEVDRLRDATNPRQLKQEIYDLLDYTLALPCADACEQ